MLFVNCIYNLPIAVVPDGRLRAEQRHFEMIDGSGGFCVNRFAVCDHVVGLAVATGSVPVEPSGVIPASGLREKKTHVGKRSRSSPIIR